MIDISTTRPNRPDGPIWWKWQRCEACRWRVRYQRGLPRQVFSTVSILFFRLGHYLICSCAASEISTSMFPAKLKLQLRYISLQCLSNFVKTQGISWCYTILKCMEKTWDTQDMYLSTCPFALCSILVYILRSEKLSRIRIYPFLFVVTKMFVDF